MDTIRGHHSTGVVHSDRSTDKVLTAKELGAPFQSLFSSKSFNEMMRGYSKVLIGHNRWATKGGISVETAHPFSHGPIHGVHNGTLTRQYLLPDWRDFEVDSENIFYSINKIGVEETVSKLAGAFALVWYNEETKELNFLRNDERPLKFAFSENGKTLYWASEEWMLKAAFERFEIKYSKILDFDPLLWYRMGVNSYNNGGTLADHKFLNKFIVKRLEQAPPIVYQGYEGHSGRGNYNYWRDGEDDWFAPNGNGGRPVLLPPFDKHKEKNLITPLDYTRCLNRMLMFKVVDCDPSLNKGYITLETDPSNTMMTKCGIEARLFLSNKSDVWAMFDVGDKVTAQVKKVTSHAGETYLLIDKRSLSERKYPKRRHEVHVEKKSFVQQVVKQIGDHLRGSNAEDYQDDLMADLKDEPQDMVKVGEAGYYIPVSDFPRLVKDGCCNCSERIDIEDVEEITWLGDNPVCFGCTDLIKQLVN